jgi:hypothetical protein
MKIIKVVHANTDENISNEAASFIIHKYDVKTFLKRQQKHLEEYTKSIPFDIYQAVEQYIETKYRWWHIENLVTRLFNSDFFFNRARPLLLARTENFVEQTVDYLLKDIINQIEKFETVSLDQAKSKYSESRNLSIGTYTLHPRNSLRLARIESYHKNLALEKDDELIVLLGRMGAKSLRIITSDASEKSGSLQVEAEVIKFDAKVGGSLSSKLEKGKDLLVEFEGNTVDIDPDLLVKSLWFSDDSQLLSIFESRTFRENRIEKYILNNTYTETFDFNFDIAVKYLAVKTDLEAEYQSISKKERLFQVEFAKKQN